MVSTVLLISAAVSVDSLVTGVSYGLKRVALPPLSKGLVSLESGAAIAIAIVIGRVVSSFVPALVARLAAAVLLVGLGVSAIISGRRASVIRLLSQPELADTDLSGEISINEAIVLGVALAMDCFAMGLGLALTELGWFVPGLCCGLACLVSMCAGELAGNWFAVEICMWGPLLSVLPGVVMVLLGLSRLL